MKRILISLSIAFMASNLYAGLWDAQEPIIDPNDPLEPHRRWSNEANWQDDLVPSNVESAVIIYSAAQAGGFYPLIDSTHTNTVVGDILLGDLALPDWGGGEVVLDMTGGSLTVDSNLPLSGGNFWLGRVGFAPYDTVVDPVTMQENNAVFNISSGTVDVELAMVVGAGSQATVNQTGGDITTQNLFVGFDGNADGMGDTPADGFNQYNLDGGTLTVESANFFIYENSNLDIGGGTLTVNAANVHVNNLISLGRLTAFDVTGYVLVDDTSDPGNLILTGTPGLLPGDFNFSQTVDGSDFLLWQQGFGTTYDATDLADWQAHYGEIFTPPLSAIAVAIPEPSTLLLSIGLIGVCTCFRYRSNV